MTLLCLCVALIPVRWAAPIMLSTIRVWNPLLATSGSCQLSASSCNLWSAQLNLTTALTGFSVSNPTNPAQIWEHRVRLRCRSRFWRFTAKRCNMEMDSSVAGLYNKFQRLLVYTNWRLLRCNCSHNFLTRLDKSLAEGLTQVCIRHLPERPRKLVKTQTMYFDGSQWMITTPWAISNTLMKPWFEFEIWL